MSKAIVWNDGVNPVHSGLYIVNREALGTPFRWFDADTETWSRCEYEYELTEVVKGTKSPIGFLPWRGPVKVVPTVQSAEVKLVNGQIDTSTAVEVDAAPAKAKRVAGKAKVTKAAKVVHPDGTIFFREDRQKWVVVIDGKQPAARPTAEGCAKWLASKFPTITANVLA